MNSDAFDHESGEFVLLKNIVGDILKKRNFDQDEGKKEMFSPFITQVNEQCGHEVSIQLLCEFFDRNLDPFIAQQIARFYYFLKNWDKAEEYAQKATELQPKSSFLWDTFGQVYKAQLLDEKDKVERQIDKSKILDNNYVQKMIDLAEKAIFHFKKVQEITENHPSENNENNLAGYFGELKTQIILLRLLDRCQCFRTRSHLMHCLVNKDFSEQCFSFLKPEEIFFLCQLEDNCMNTIRVLDEQYLQVREDVQFDAAGYSGTFGREVQNLISLMFSFHDFFGAPKDFSYIKSLPEPIASMHRWRVAVKHGAMSLNFLLRYRAELEGSEQFISNLVTIYNIMLPNVISKYVEFNYLLAMLNALTLLIIDGKAVRKCKKLSYQHVLDFSKKLFECKQPNEKRPYVEPYMYFVMFNFPSETRNKYSMCSVYKLQEACDRWRNAYIQKFKDAEARTLFYLAKGGILNDLVHSDTFPMKGRDNWEDPNMRKHLVLYSGTVELGGKTVKVKVTKDKNTFELNIPTSYTVKKSFWQKDTYFFIGFSFSGPKAYGIPQDPPEAHEIFDEVWSVEEKHQEPSRNSPQLHSISELINLQSKLDEKQVKIFFLS
ncbi:hypothetical protein Btru_055813 [Bulinus truncatus]|nr:hypothetical protein Btru_055813 [Bulinus truncatus]